MSASARVEGEVEGDGDRIEGFTAVSAQPLVEGEFAAVLRLALVHQVAGDGVGEGRAPGVVAHLEARVAGAHPPRHVTQLEEAIDHRHGATGLPAAALPRLADPTGKLLALVEEVANLRP